MQIKLETELQHGITWDNMGLSIKIPTTMASLSLEMQSIWTPLDAPWMSMEPPAPGGRWPGQWLSQKEAERYHGPFLEVDSYSKLYAGGNPGCANPMCFLILGVC